MAEVPRSHDGKAGGEPIVEIASPQPVTPTVLLAAIGIPEVPEILQEKKLHKVDSPAGPNRAAL